MKRRRNLPTLGAMRVFEAAARHGSFKDAAAELAVTPTSVSHQVRSLEAQLGLPLFERFNRRVTLTPAGAALAEALTGALDTMDEAVALARGTAGQAREERLVVAGNPGLLDCWLRARLPGFGRRHPEIALELIPSDETAAMLAGRADIALHFGSPPSPPLAARLLWRTVYFPVCRPLLRHCGNPPIWRARPSCTSSPRHGGAPGSLRPAALSAMPGGAGRSSIPRHWRSNPRSPATASLWPMN